MSTEVQTQQTTKKTAPAEPKRKRAPKSEKTQPAKEKKAKKAKAPKKVAKEQTVQPQPTVEGEKPKTARNEKIDLVSDEDLKVLDNKGVKELREYAKRMGMREYSNLKKEELKGLVERISTLHFTDEDVKFMSSKLLRSIARGSGLTGYSKVVKKENIVDMIKTHRSKGGVIGFSGTTKSKRGKVITEPFDMRSGPNTYSRGQLQQYASLLDLKGYSDKTFKIGDLQHLIKQAVEDSSQLKLDNLKIRALKRAIKLYKKDEPKLVLKGSPEELYNHLQDLRKKFGPKTRIHHTLRVVWKSEMSYKEMKSLSRQIGICGFTKMKTKDLQELLNRIHDNKLTVQDYNVLSLKALKYISKIHKIKISKMNDNRRVPMTRIELFEKITGLKVDPSQVKTKGNPDALRKYKETKQVKPVSPAKPVKKQPSPVKVVEKPKATKTSGGKNTKKK